MIIDSHTHLGRNEHINISVDQILASMDAAGIEKSLVFAGDMNDAPNNWTAEQLRPHRDRLKMVACAQPLKFSKMGYRAVDASKLADQYQSGDIVAVKFYTGYDHYYPNDEEAQPYLEHLNDVGCPAIFHMGDCLNSVKCAKLKYALPIHVDDVAVDYPQMNFIIAHMGYPWVKDAAEVCFKNKNVFADISGFVYGKFSTTDKFKFQNALLEFMSIADSDKLLFGTDFPISDQSSYINALSWAAESVYPKTEREVFSPEYLTQNVIQAFKLKV